MKYSVIIPAYNSEITLRRCLDSLIDQIPAEAEILLVNDGSSDGTEKLLISYAERCHGIKLFSKSNGGVSSARNMGLDNASGDYVLFIDADDAVREDYFLRIDEALTDNPDMLLFSKQLLGDTNRCIVQSNRETEYNGRLQACRFLSNCMRKQELNLITTKAFRRDIIETNHLRFDERLDIGEDKVFAFAFSLNAERIKRIPDNLYYLSMDGRDSLSRKKRDSLCESVLLEHRIMTDLLNESKLSDKCRKLYSEAICYSFYRSAYTVSGELRKYDYSAEERRSRIRGILESYSGETGYDPKELYCRFISLPIRKKQADLVDFAMRFFYKRGN